MGKNEWRGEYEWPPSRAVPYKLHLRASGLLSPDAPGAQESPLKFMYDPLDPVPTVGGCGAIIFCLTQVTPHLCLFY